MSKGNKKPTCNDNEHRVEVMRQTLRATDLYAAFLLYTAHTPFLGMHVGLTHVRFSPLASLFEIHVQYFTAYLTDKTFPRMSLPQW
jgi:hypothetical protein